MTDARVTTKRLRTRRHAIVGAAVAAALPAVGLLPAAAPASAASAIAPYAPAGVAAASVTDAEAYPCGGYGGLEPTNPVDDVLADRFTWGDYRRLVVGDGTGNINWKANPPGNVSWVTWLHSLAWIGSAIHLGSTGISALRRPEALDHALAIAHDWVQDNPPPWTDGPGAGNAVMRRTNTLLCLRQAVVQVTGDSPAWLDASLREHATFMDALGNRGHWGTSNLATDREIALMGIGCTFRDPKIINAAVGRLSRAITTSVDAQGANDEQSIGYADWNWSLWTKAEKYITTCKVTTPAAAVIHARRASLQSFLDQATSPSGKLFQLGDTDTTVQTADRSPTQAWVLTKGARGKAPVQRVAIYQAGYVFGRSGWGSGASVPLQSAYSLRFGPARIGHGHADHTAMTWQTRGRDILIDSGHGQYNADAWRAYYSGPTAHNQVVFAGHTSGARETALTRASTTNGDSFEFLDHPLSSRTRARSVYFAKGADLMVVRDALSSQTVPTSWTQYWHLPHDQNVTVTGHAATAIKPGQNVKTTILQLPVKGQQLTPLSVVKGQTRGGVQGWYWKDVFTKYAAPVVTTKQSGKAGTMLTAVVVSTAREAVSALPPITARNGATVYRVAVGTRTLRFTVSPTGTIGA